MSTIPRFLACDNFMEDEDTEYVFHTQAPRFLAKWDDEREAFDIAEEYDDIHAHFNNNEAKILALMQEMVQWFSDYDAWLEVDEEE